MKHNRRSKSEFDLDALVRRLVEIDSGGRSSLDDIEYLGIDAVLPYYSRAFEIINNGHGIKC